MSGSLTELAAIGAQDQYLFVEPEITFFKGDYKRHSNFSVEPLKNFFSPELRLNGTGICTIERNGDLIKDQFLVVKLPDLHKINESIEYVPEVGHAMIETISLEIGGHTFVEMTGDFMSISHELEDKAQKEVGLQVGKVEQISSVPGLGSVKQVQSPGSGAVTLYVPLMFWYNKTYSQALPLIALAYHDVKIKLKLRGGKDIVRLKSDAAETSLPSSLDIKLDTSLQPHILTEYFFLDDEERLGFANNPQEYLIETVQYNGPASIPTGVDQVTVRLDFNHPVHELLFLAQQSDRSREDGPLDADNVGSTPSDRDYFNYTIGQNRSAGPIKSAQLTLNGHPRFAELDAFYFYHIQPSRMHSAKPNYGDGRFIHCWNFGLFPEDHKPSGSLNFSRIDTANLRIVLSQPPRGLAAEVRCYAKSRNVVRIRSGMAGLRYAN